MILNSDSPAIIRNDWDDRMFIDYRWATIPNIRREKKGLSYERFGRGMRIYITSPERPYML